MRVVDQDLTLELRPGSAPAREGPVQHSSSWIQLEDGWASSEGAGRWSLGATSTVSVTLDTPRPRTLFLRAKSLRDPSRNHTQRVTVSWNQTSCGTITVPPRTATLAVDIPERLQRPGVNTLSFAYSFVASPASLGINPDERPLGVSFDWMAVRTAPTSGAGLLERVRRVMTKGSAGPPPSSVRFDNAHGLIRFDRSAELVLSGRVPRTARALALAVGGGRPQEGGRVTITLTELDGTRQVVLDTVPDGATHAVPLDPWRGRDVVLEIAAEVGPGSSPVELHHPRLVLGPSTAMPGEPAPPAAASSQPDIVVLILDAARADHFGCYGYARDTTPNIDRLARSSLRFEQVYALAPYTLTSVPTMLTGLSFLQHGVLVRGDRLSAAARTLAEVLHGVGYQTAAFTPSPYDSSVTGCDQGYESYHEVWRGVSPTVAIDPHRLTKLVIQWLRRSRDPGRPLHLLVHYVPPHTPYSPPARFDVFTDPGYRGSQDGTVDSLRAIDNGLVRPSAADLDHIRALYDGNLRRGDDAVAQLLAVLRESPRWRDTVVLVTADHGDAFFEHGRMGHNSTLYDEMLHVPFILRLPPAVGPVEADEAQLATLADLTPTLCRLAGAPAPPDLAGRDLLTTAPRPADRFFVTRTAGEGHDLGLRSTRFAVITGPGGRRELYDLAQDPGEQHNLAGLRPGLFAGLERFIEERVRTAKPIAAEKTTVERRERELLEALGYVD
jgi:choline-sulfatase